MVEKQHFCTSLPRTRNTMMRMQRMAPLTGLLRNSSNKSNNSHSRLVPRLLLSTSSSSSVRSRRAVHRLQQEQQQAKTTQLSSSSPSSSASSSSSKEAADAGWPKSVRYSFYFLTATLGPYSILWLLSSIPSVVRDEYLTDEQRDWLRKYYGSEEEGALAYVDVNDEHEDGRVLRLPQEPTQRQRILAKEQEALNETNLSVRVSLYQRDSSNNNFTKSADTASSSLQEVSVTVPGRVLARLQDLKDYLGQTVDTSDKVMAGLEFADNTKDSLTTTLDEAPMSSEELETDYASSGGKDPLLLQTSVYSAWHHFESSFLSSQTPVTQSATPSKTGSSVSSSDAWLVKQLQDDIVQLQYELKQPSPLRDIDDLQEELRTKQASLRQLKWRQWVPWW